MIWLAILGDCDMPVVPEDVINPGIRRTVEWLNSLGYTTVDSGDGETHDYECDREEPYVVVQAMQPIMLTPWSDRLKELLEEKGVTVSPVGQGPVFIEASYDPVNKLPFINITGVTDAMLFGDDDADT
jgi:hypothetical protein